MRLIGLRYAIFEIDDGEVECDQEFVLDRVIIDTTCLKTANCENRVF